MGESNVNSLTAANKAEFLRRLLDDIEALEQMIEGGQIESGVTRIGAEQELCLVRESLRPAMTGPRILEALGHPNYTHELAQWNLEVNLDPQVVGPDCLKKVEDQLTGLLALGQAEARRHDSDLLLTGILPTIRKSELDFRTMTPSPRFSAFNDVLRELRGEDFLLYIEGVDEVYLKHSSILFEACNTSFQIHLQVDPQEFADRYNWAQVIAGPVLAACVNSPLLLGKELWAETRIALFRQSIEIRHANNYMRDSQPRVAFGHHWLQSSAAEIFKADISVYLLILAASFGDEPFATELLRRGEIPRLRAMNLHNGTLYKWNRACYGISDGKPHLRIENRYIPSGPTPLDQLANLAFWVGLMHAMPDDCRGRWPMHFNFQEVRSNFLKAAQHGLNSELKWFGSWYGASQLVLERLLPMAAEGLERLGIPHDAYARYLMIIEDRVASRQTGSNWIVKSLRALRQKQTLEESLLLITRHMRENGLSDRPVHTWKLADAGHLHAIPDRYARVDSIMITTLVTVREDDLIVFASKLLEWNGFRHLPVENNKGELTGIISIKDIDRLKRDGEVANATVADLMTSDVLVVAPETPLDKAERMMIANEVGSLPVVRDNRLIGIITVKDIIGAKERLDGFPA